MIRLRILAALASLFLLTCARDERPAAAAADPGVTDTEIVLGSWGPLSGPAALWGSVLRGMETYFDLINEEGGIHGRRIRFVYRDDGYEPPRTVAAVREMVQRDQVFAFASGLGTAPGMAVRDFITSNRIPWVAPASGSSHWAWPRNRYIFSVYPLYADEAAAIVDHAVSTGVKKIGIVYQNDDYGKGGLVGAEMAAEKQGTQIVAALPTEMMDTDLSSHIVRLRQAGADGVLLWVAPRQAAILIGTAANLNFKPRWFASTTLSDIAMMHRVTQGLWSGVTFATLGNPWDTEDPTMQRYRQAFEKKHPDIQWGAFPSAGFLFAEPMVEGLRRAGRDLTREKLVEALETLDGFQGSGPSITFGPETRQGTRSVMLMRCLSATEYELIAGWTTPTIDAEEAVRRLAAR
ncbi:MAG TPA: ABC transporter substrate-binding protein [Thermoanaerobaculia bacterium]|nr:ABC transporter substrate-binding protein [Thermoanaerobaculia bacterium]